MYNTGQSCCSVERIYVHESIHDAFVEHFVATVQGLRIGDPMDDATYIGAITRAPQLDVLEAQVADALAKGATLHCGGHALPGPGNWFEPTVFSGVNHTMELMREESFGPIIGIQKVRQRRRGRRADERHALRPDGRRLHPRRGPARALLAQVNAGSVYWNCCDRVSPRLPWSGHGDSGVGLTLSTYGIQTFTRPKAWHLRQPPDAADALRPRPHAARRRQRRAVVRVPDGPRRAAARALRGAQPRDGARLRGRRGQRAGLLRLLRRHAGRAQRRRMGAAAPRLPRRT